MDDRIPDTEDHAEQDKRPGRAAHLPEPGDKGIRSLHDSGHELLSFG